MKQESVWFTTRIRNTKRWEERWCWPQEMIIMLIEVEQFDPRWSDATDVHTPSSSLYSVATIILTLSTSLSVYDTIFGVTLHIAISVRLGGTILSLSQEHYDSVSYKHWLKILTTVHCSHNTPCNWILHNILSLQAVSGRYDFKFCCFFRFNSLQASYYKNFRSDSIQAMQVSNMNGWLSCIVS